MYSVCHWLSNIFNYDVTELHEAVNIVILDKSLSLIALTFINLRFNVQIRRWVFNIYKCKYHVSGSNQSSGVVRYR